MKKEFAHIGLAKLCGWFGITRQAYYQNSWRTSEISIEEDLILNEVLEIRKYHSRMGTRKLYEKLEPFMREHQIKMGRDALFDLLAANNLLVRKRKRKVKTTQSFHWLRKYPNLIREFIPTGINQLWVSDITYWKINGDFVYISFITDAFSHKIVGYHVADTLESVETIKALKMAILGLNVSKTEETCQLIHHSDRGVQYCHHEYVKLLNKNNIKISMTENGDPLENAVAERINGIMKDEYLQDYDVVSIEQAKDALCFAVELYNTDRPHNSISNLTPDMVHNNNTATERLWKNYYKKRKVKSVEAADY